VKIDKAVALAAEVLCFLFMVVVTVVIVASAPGWIKLLAAFPLGGAVVVGKAARDVYEMR
jgi:hypothetical protein